MKVTAIICRRSPDETWWPYVTAEAVALSGEPYDWRSALAFYSKTYPDWEFAFLSDSLGDKICTL